MTDFQEPASAAVDQALRLRERMLSDHEVVESRHVVLALMKADEIEVAIEWLRDAYPDDPLLRIEDHGVYYRIDREEELVFDVAQIEELLGKPYSIYDFLVNVSTTIGRAYIAGEIFTLTTRLVGIEQSNW